MAHADRALAIRSYGTVVCLGVFKGIGSIAPLAKELKAAGNRIVSLLGAKIESDLL